DSKVVRKYIDNPVDTLLDKTRDEIIDIAGKIIESIEKGDIELKDKKRDNILQELDKFKVDYFEMFIEKYSEAKMKVGDAEKELGEIKIKDDIEKIKKSVEKYKIMLSDKEIEIVKMEKETGSINVSDIKKGLEETITKEIGRSVRVM
ncbi:MAG: hypothetical protein KAR20_27735, partial [Candidatus Heimdallarchaeota archaeon]|nr:hypothetical protein [Candidatus Heimdallarchaeota archaeon]